MIKTYKEFLTENLQDILREPSLFASKEAAKLGLEYYGFSRYGKNDKTTHVVFGGELAPISDTLPGEESEDRKFQIQAYEVIDNADKEFDHYFKKRERLVEHTHELLAPAYDWRGLKPDERKILESYLGESYDTISDAVTRPNRSGNIQILIDNEETTVSVNELINLMDSIMEKTESPIQFHTFIGLEDMKDLHFENYRPTTLNPRLVLRSKNIVQLSVHKGASGMYIDGNYTVASTAGLREFILPRNSSISIDTSNKILSPEGEVIHIYQGVIIS